MEEAVGPTGCLLGLGLGVTEMCGGWWGGVPAVQETVILVAASTEQRLVGV